jgi:hypothetical protein
MSKRSNGAGGAPESGFPVADPFERHQPERDVAKRGTRPPVDGEAADREKRSPASERRGGAEKPG